MKTSFSEVEVAKLPKTSQRLLIILSQFDMDKISKLEISWKEMGEFSGDLVLPVVKVEFK